MRGIERLPERRREGWADGGEGSFPGAVPRPSSLVSRLSRRIRSEARLPRIRHATILQESANYDRPVTCFWLTMDLPSEDPFSSG